MRRSRAFFRRRPDADDGLDIHFIHVRSKHTNALPLIVLAGSVIEQLKDRRSAHQSHSPSRERIGRVLCGDGDAAPGQSATWATQTWSRFATSVAGWLLPAPEAPLILLRRNFQ